jgi:hypothetical protein
MPPGLKSEVRTTVLDRRCRADLSDPRIIMLSD